MNRKSHIIRHLLTLQIFSASKSCAFGKTVKKCSIDLTWQIKLSCTKVTCRSHKVKLRAGVTCRNYVQGACKLPKVICIYKWVELYKVDSSKIKYKCQLVVRIKANECYQELLSYLSFYNFLVSDPCLSSWPFYKCY